MNARETFEPRETIPFRRPGISDSSINHEWVLQQRLRAWIATGLNLFGEINEGSVCGFKISPEGFQDFVHDELPVKLTELGGYNFTGWDERINEAARGLK